MEEQKPRTLENIAETKTIPTIILLEQQILYPDSKGYWYRFNDGLYRNPYCPDVSFEFSMFERAIEVKTAKIESYAPHTKQTLLALFPADKCLSEHSDILDLYRD
ncbi:MAG: hypothetical protein ACP5N2_06375 [Candidatus Nanoarchaeia archaeon]